MEIRVQNEAFSPWQEAAAFEARHPHLAGKAGACTVFVGTLRDFNADQTVVEMTLEHYPGMTEKQLARIAAEASERWPLLDVLVIHRYGRLRPADPIVLAAVWSAHRAAAFEACRHLVEGLKTRAPFWKHEQTAKGERWVAPEGRTESAP